jgi:hypothetical protein
MNRELLQVIRTANREFQRFIQQVAPNLATLVQARGASERLGNLNSCLKCVAQQFGADVQLFESEPAGAHEIMQYRENLLALRRHLGSLQFSLLAERDRLEGARANLQSARAWAASLREIS